MSDKYSALTVVLDRDVSEAKITALSEAIGQFQGVISVQSIISDSFAEHIAKERLRTEMGKKLLDIVFERSSG